jgi:aminoglycoside phosphotransferase (APT) family kinase protein
MDMPADDANAEAQAKVAAWIEREIGPVVRITREGRWRPVWFVDAQADGAPVPLYVRGARGSRWPPMPLAYEARVQTILGEHGVKAPRVYGYVDDVPAIVMHRAPGRPNMALAASEADRERLREQLADQMRLIHEVDPKLIEAAGSPNPKDPRELTLCHYRQVEALYLSGERLPSPDIEFIRRWLDRNVPPCEEGPAVIAMDAGQFIFEGDELTAMLDFEFVGVGDRHVDFAALRTRDQFEQIGPLEAFYKLYEARGGKPVDLDRVRYQSVAFSLFTPLEVADDLARPRDAADYHEYLTWHFTSIKDALDDMAEILHLDLEPYELPPAGRSRAGVALEAVAHVLSAMPAPDDYSAYRRDKLGMAVRFLTRKETFRSALEREYLDDLEALLGRRPVDDWDGDVRLEAFVQTAGPEFDERLLRLLYRRAKRLALLIADRTSWLGDSFDKPRKRLQDEPRTA